MNAKNNFEADAQLDVREAKRAASEARRVETLLRKREVKLKARNILRQLFDADELARQEAIEEARRVSDENVANAIAFELIKQLKNGKGETRTYAEEALLAIGLRLIIPIAAYLLKYRGKKLRLRLVQILTEVGKDLEREDRNMLCSDLAYIANHTRSKPLIKACLEATVRIREKVALDDVRLNRLVWEAEWRLLTPAQHRVLYDQPDPFDAFSTLFGGGGF